MQSGQSPVILWAILFDYDNVLLILLSSYITITETSDDKIRQLRKYITKTSDDKIRQLRKYNLYSIVYY